PRRRRVRRRPLPATPGHTHRVPRDRGARRAAAGGQSRGGAGMTVLANAPARRRSVLGWGAIGVVLVVVGAAVAAIAGIAQLPAQGLLDPEAASPDGGRALTEVLRTQGVEVTT